MSAAEGRSQALCFAICFAKMTLRCKALDVEMLKSSPMRFVSLLAPAHFLKNSLPCFHYHIGRAMSSKSAIAISGAAAFLAAQSFVTPVAPTGAAQGALRGAAPATANSNGATTPLAIKATAATAALLAVAGILAKG